MNNPNDIVQVKHTDSIAAAIKDFMQFHSENSSGNDFNLFIDDGTVKCFMSTASLSGNIVTCGNDSITLTGFADNLSLQDSKFFDSNNNQVGSLTFNVTDCCYDFNFSSDAFNPNLQTGDTISVNSDAPCRLSCSAFPDNNYWYEAYQLGTGDDAEPWALGRDESYGAGLSFTQYYYNLSEGIKPLIKQTNFNELTYYAGANGIFQVWEFLVTDQVAGTSSIEYEGDLYRVGQLSAVNGASAFWVEDFMDSEGKRGKTLVLTDKAFGFSSQADVDAYWAITPATEGGDETDAVMITTHDLTFVFTDKDADESNNLVGNVRYVGNYASESFPESFVENADGSYTYTRQGYTSGFYSSTEYDTAINGYRLKYRDSIQGGDTCTLYGFASGLSLCDRKLLLNGIQVGELKNGYRFNISDFRALDDGNVPVGGTHTVSLVDNDPNGYNVTYELDFDSALKTKKVVPGICLQEGNRHIFYSTSSNPYVDLTNNPDYDTDTNTATAIYHAQDIRERLFAVDGLSVASFGELVADEYYRIYKNGTVSSGYMIGRIESQQLELNTNALSGLSCSATGEVLSITNFNGNRFAFNTNLISAVASSDDSDVTISNGSLNYYGNSQYSSRSTVGFYTNAKGNLAYCAEERYRKTFIISGLRTDFTQARLYNDCVIQARTDSDSDYIDIGCIDGFTITLFESAFPARQSVTVTATDGNSYSFTPDYSATLSGTNAADFTLVLP